MDSQKEVLVRGCAKHVGDGPEFEGPEGSISEVVCQEDLESDDAGDNILGQGLGAAELGYLWKISTSPEDCSDRLGTVPLGAP